MNSSKSHVVATLGRDLALLALVWLLPVGARAQSADLNFPTPVYTDEIGGRIAPRDLGDSRLTSHFYNFNGTQGDLVLMIESFNLDGAVDVFLAAGMRPLTQSTLYAGNSALNVTKSVFLRQPGALVLRVQARTPNDADGTYRIRLSGAFQPSTAPAGTPPVTAEVTPQLPRPPDRNTHRVNSVGARIDEPAAEGAAQPAAPELTQPVETATPTPARTRTPTARRGRTRGTSTRAEPTRRTSAPATAAANKPAAADATPAATAAPPSTNGNEPTAAAAAEPTPARGRANRSPRPSRTTPTARRASPAKESSAAKSAAPKSAEPAAAAPQLPGARLVIETKDGARIVRDMNEVSRLSVANNLVVVVLKTGRVERYALPDVLRMAIEP